MVEIKKEKIIGVLGGMGPYATVGIFKQIIDLTPAKKEWEHLRIIIDNNPKIPSRTRYFLYNEESPKYELIETAKNLEKAGADFIIMGCSTSYYWKYEVQKAINIPILDMFEESRKYILEKMPNIKKVGLLTADTVYDLKLFDKDFGKKDIEIIIPDEDGIKKIRDVIEYVKTNDFSNNPGDILKDVSISLIEKGVEAIILGCTELQIALKKSDLDVPIFDATKILALAAVNKAKGI